MRPHIAYTHNEPCVTLIRHFCDDLGQFTLKDDKGRHVLRCLIPFYNTLQCSLSLLWPFLTFSEAFRPFVTFLDFALFNTLPDCVAFSSTFHQTLFTWLVHHSCGFSGICRSDRPCTSPTFRVSFYYYSCIYGSCYHNYQIEQRVPPSTVLQCIDLRSRCASRHCRSRSRFSYIAPITVAFFGTLSHCLYEPIAYLNDTFWPFSGPLYHIYTLILPPFHCKRQVILS